jgi:hypothetical protein
MLGLKVETHIKVETKNIFNPYFIHQHVCNIFYNKKNVKYVLVLIFCEMVPGPTFYRVWVSNLTLASNLKFWIIVFFFQKKN